MPLERFSEFGQYNCTAKTFESKKYMEQFIDSCFNPSNLQFFVFNELTNDGYTILDEDYTKCYYNDKLSKHLSSSCRHSAVIDGEITNDFSLATVLFESDFPVCIETVPEN